MMGSSRAILHQVLDLKMMHLLELGQVRSCGRQNGGSRLNLGVREGFLEEVPFPLNCGDSRSLTYSWGGGRIKTEVAKGRLSLDVLIA